MNDIFSALFSSSSGATAPSPTVGGMWWLDTSASPAVLKVRNTANTAWIEVSPETLPANTVWANLTGSAAAPVANDMAALGAALANSAGPTNTTSGSAVDFTGLPSGINWVEVIFDQVSLTTSEHLLVQISSSSTFLNAGYLSTSCYVSQTAANTTNGVGHSSGFVLYVGGAGDTVQGRMRLTRKPGTNDWVQDHTARKGSNSVSGGGFRTAGGALDGIRITRTSTGDFDNGNVSLRWGY